MESKDYLGLFRVHVPAGFLRKVLAKVYDCYAFADAQCNEFFEEPEAVNMRPFYRRALVEQSLREAVGGFGGVAATAVRGPVGEKGQGGWWFHTLVRCGPVAFTQNTVGDANAFVRPSYFRRGYAAMNRQLFLFPQDEPDRGNGPGQLPEGIRLYGILLHGQSGRAPLPNFAVIRFPNYDYDGYLPGSIDLFQEFPDMVAEHTKALAVSSVEVEQVEQPMPQLLVGRGAKDAQG